MEQLEPNNGLDQRDPRPGEPSFPILTLYEDLR